MPNIKNNKDLVKHLIELGVLKSVKIVDAFESVDRKDFVPEEYKELAYQDSALPIGYGQTISQPYTVAFMLELLEPKETHKILDIGSGSAWTTALLAHIAKKGSVLGKEIIPELVEFGLQNLQKYNFNNAKIEKAKEGVLGDPSRAPFDRILVSAGAEEFPSELLEQIKEDGIIVAPVKNSIVKVYKEAGKFVMEEYPGFSFVPLVKYRVTPQSEL